MEQQTVTLEDATNIAIAHMKQENYRVAELVLQDILKSQPEDANSNYLLALARYFMGDINGALEPIEKAVKNEEAQAEWWCNYGIMLTELTRYEEAKKAYEKAIAADPNYGEAYWNKSHSHWLNDEYTEAESAARQGIEINPKSEQSWLNLGTALVKLDRREEAIECWETVVKINPGFVFAWNNLGNALREMGQLEASAEKCRKALALDPNYPQALNNLGNSLMDMDNLPESEELYRKTVTLKPDYIEAHNNLAINLIKQNRFQEAIQQARIALSYDGNYLGALLSVGTASKAIGEITDAEKALQKAILIQPESAEVRIDMAELLFMKDRYADAEIELERARELEPDTPRIYLKLADVLERGNKIDEALEAIDKAVELNPEMPEAYLRKGLICHVANRVEDAEDYFTKAMEMTPDGVNAHLAMAELRLSTGQSAEAHDHVKKAQELAPNMPSLFFTLAKTKKFSDENDEDLQKMITLEKAGESIGIQQLSSLNFALFSAHEQIGDYDKAFEHLIKANSFKRQMVPYDAGQQSENFKALQEAYSKETLKHYEGLGFESDIPVFILGMPRSGTTLTEQIISSHADVLGAGELMEISTLDAQLGPLTPENTKAQGQWYVEQVTKRDESGKALRITDKMPGNFSSLGKIVSILPNAKIIHTRRNPIDTCLSCYKQSFARGQYWCYEMEELGRYYNDYLELMAHWRDVLGDKFIEIDYEETVGNFEPQARGLIDYVGLPWDDACLEPHKQKRAVLTASKAQVTKPIYKTSVKAWKRYEKQLEPLISALSAGPAKDLLDL